MTHNWGGISLQTALARLWVDALSPDILCWHELWDIESARAAVPLAYETSWSSADGAGTGFMVAWKRALCRRPEEATLEFDGDHWNAALLPLWHVLFVLDVHLHPKIPYREWLQQVRRVEQLRRDLQPSYTYLAGDLNATDAPGTPLSSALCQSGQIHGYLQVLPSGTTTNHTTPRTAPPVPPTPPPPSPEHPGRHGQGRDQSPQLRRHYAGAMAPTSRCPGPPPPPPRGQLNLWVVPHAGRNPPILVGRALCRAEPSRKGAGAPATPPEWAARWSDGAVGRAAAPAPRLPSWAPPYAEVARAVVGWLGCALVTPPPPWLRPHRYRAHAPTSIRGCLSASCRPVEVAHG